MLSLTSEQEKMFKQYYPAAVKLASTSGMEFGSGLSLALIALCKSVQNYNSKIANFSTFYHTVFVNLVASPYYKGQYYGDDKYTNINSVAMNSLKRKLKKLKKSATTLNSTSGEAIKLLQDIEDEMTELTKNRLMSLNYVQSDTHTDKSVHHARENTLKSSDYKDERLMVVGFKDYAKKILTGIEYKIIMLYVDGYTSKEISEKLNISHINVRIIKHRILPSLREYYK